MVGAKFKLKFDSIAQSLSTTSSSMFAEDDFFLVFAHMFLSCLEWILVSPSGEYLPFLVTIKEIFSFLKHTQSNGVKIRWSTSML